MIKLIKNKKPIYNSIYSLKKIKLEILHIEINIKLNKDFIASSKFSAKVTIFLVDLLKKK